MATGDEDALLDALDKAFVPNPNATLAKTLAVVVVQGGRVIAERYANGVTASTRLISWSTAKSITQAILGCAVADGLIDLDATPVAPEWADPNDPRHGIRWADLLQMRSGLRFNEDYVDAGTSDCLEMLFGAGAADMAGYAASQQLVEPIGTTFNYASGTTNIVSRAIGAALAASGTTIEQYLNDRLFAPLGMRTATPTTDDSGTFVGSSYVHATARDFARFGELYLRDGMWDGQRILPKGWVDRARTPVSEDPETGLSYGEQWWVWNDEYGTFSANGYEGQLIAVVPALDLVMVRLGKTPIEHRPELFEFYNEIIAACAPEAPQ
jgi:CubicO group peptidase (beta-lactamase class C family)